MATQETDVDAQGVYLYAIGQDLAVQDLGKIGVEGSEVYTIEEGNLRAVVSDVPRTREMRPERRHLAAHQKVVNSVLERSETILPVSFGTIADDEAGVRSLLRRFAEMISEQMDRLKGGVQMNVRVSYSAKEPSVFEYLLTEREPELKALRDRIFGGGRAASREEKIDFGQQIEAALNRLRDEFAEKLEKLSTQSRETKVLSPRNEQEIVRIACLVAKDATDAFDAAVKEIAQSIDDRFTVEESGPFPAYDFAELHLSSIEEGAEEGTGARADS
jgi:hypothetical protein